LLERVSGFDWDSGNRSKCAKHGVSIEEIEELFQFPVMVFPDAAHSRAETRFRAVGKTAAGRHVFLVFAVRENRIRPISARFMHAKEIRHYEKENPDVQD
jgi:uncharacterized protein